jgi:hypothetical protein
LPPTVVGFFLLQPANDILAKRQKGSLKRPVVPTARPPFGPVSGGDSRA